jgi:hypothetical protein
MAFLQSRVFRLSALWLSLIALCLLLPAAANEGDPVTELASLLRSARAEAAASGRRIRLHLSPSGGPLTAELRSADGRVERRLLRTDVILLRAPEWIDFGPTGTLRVPAGHRQPPPPAFDPGFHVSDPSFGQDLVFDAESERVFIDVDEPSGRIARLIRLARRNAPSLGERIGHFLRSCGWR